jgi:hypothetical protein
MPLKIFGNYGRRYTALAGVAAALITQEPAKASPGKSNTSTTPSRAKLLSAQEKTYSMTLVKDGAYVEQINYAIENSGASKAESNDAKQIRPATNEVLAATIRILQNIVLHHFTRAEEYKSTVLREQILEKARGAINDLAFIAKFQKLVITETYNLSAAEKMILRMRIAAAAKLSYSQGENTTADDVIRETNTAQRAIEKFRSHFEIEYYATKDDGLLDFLKSRNHLNPEHLEATKKLRTLRRTFYMVAANYPDHKDLTEIKNKWQTERWKLFESLEKGTKDMMNALKELEGLSSQKQLNREQKKRKDFLEATLKIPKGITITECLKIYAEKLELILTHIKNLPLD